MDAGGSVHVFTRVDATEEIGYIDPIDRGGFAVERQ